MRANRNEKVKQAKKKAVDIGGKQKPGVLYKEASRKREQKKSCRVKLTEKGGKKTRLIRSPGGCAGGGGRRTRQTFSKAGNTMYITEKETENPTQVPLIKKHRRREGNRSGTSVVREGKKGK